LVGGRPVGYFNITTHEGVEFGTLNRNPPSGREEDLNLGVASRLQIQRFTHHALPAPK